ncbi:MAG: Fur family ferric uptake transcriptional regulator [Rhodothermales bacterium]|jgi:Fur family ferric uptake transcriptional regulator
MPELATEQKESVHRIFADFLKTRRQRQTPERFAVLDAVYAQPGHFDADELYVVLLKGAVKVSRATVYNTLELLCECQLVARHQFGKKQSMYEAAYSYWQHDHLICMDCNELFEFCDPRIQSIQEMVSDVFQFDIRHHSLHMYGRCRREACPNRDPAPTEA